MKRTIYTLALGVLLAVSTLTYADGAPASQPATQVATEKLPEKIDQALKLLDDKKYGDVIQLLADPKAVSGMKTAGVFDQAVADFALHSDDLHDALKQAQGKEPTLSADGQKASYVIQTKDHQSIDFILIDGKWYLK